MSFADGYKGTNTLMQDKKREINFYQRACNKHEYIFVTQTTTTNPPVQEAKSKSWMQCKHCGHIVSGYPQQVL